MCWASTTESTCATVYFNRSPLVPKLRLGTPIGIIKALGGAQSPGVPPFKPYGPVKFDTFKKGKRYWVAFSSPYDWKRYPQGVVNSWPEMGFPNDLKEAVPTDHYAHRPLYHPKSGLTHSYRAAKDKKSWQVRMERDVKLLWKADLPPALPCVPPEFRAVRQSREDIVPRRSRWNEGNIR